MQQSPLISDILAMVEVAKNLQQQHKYEEAIIKYQEILEIEAIIGRLGENWQIYINIKLNY